MNELCWIELLVLDNYTCNHFTKCKDMINYKQNYSVLEEYLKLFNRVQTIVKVKLATVVEGDQRAPFSIATTPRCRGGRYSFPFTLDTYLILLSVRANKLLIVFKNKISLKPFPNKSYMYIDLNLSKEITVVKLNC